MQRLALLLIFSGNVMAQSSSLYLVSTEEPATTPPMVNGVPDRLSPALSQASLLAVRLPPPRAFTVHDLVTIIVRESTEADSEAELEATKDYKLSGAVTAWPGVRGLDDLFDLFLKQGLEENPTLSVSANKDFQGEGSYNRRDTFTSRVTARIIDIKPNGTMVLEARKFIKSDKESMDMVLTGTCRQEDIAADNTVLSTQLYDLNLTKEHSGELRKATKKGFLSQLFDTIFAF